ncbi:MAG: hypothetical protein ACYTG0_30235 [Planctomycetota bacterium]|jgi:hypothetical protein
MRVQFSLRTIFVLMAACCLLLAWWVPSDGEVRFAHIYFNRWQPSMAALRITTPSQFCHLLGFELSRLDDWSEWPDFSKSDVIPVPLNGLAGEPTAEYRIQALEKPVSVDFRNTPLLEIVDTLTEQCGVELQVDLRQFALDGVNADMHITFHAEEVPLRSALHSMLQPHNLTFCVGEDLVCITTHRCAQSAYGGHSIIHGGDWLDFGRPKLRHRLRMRGRLVFITSFAEDVETDSRALGYAVPKGAKVLFVTDLIANILDAGYTFGVISLMVVVIVALKRWVAGVERSEPPEIQPSGGSPLVPRGSTPATPEIIP